MISSDPTEALKVPLTSVTILINVFKSTVCCCLDYVLSFHIKLRLVDESLERGLRSSLNSITAFELLICHVTYMQSSIDSNTWNMEAYLGMSWQISIGTNEFSDLFPCKMNIFRCI